ncbi:MAG: S24 family peptidase [Thiotrichaceae bacterium]
MGGDYVVIREQATAERGEIVVALIDGSVNGLEATLKYFHPQVEGSIELRPVNSSMDSMFFAADEVTIQGVVMVVSSHESADKTSTKNKRWKRMDVTGVQHLWGTRSQIGHRVKRTVL